MKKKTFPFEAAPRASAYHRKKIEESREVFNWTFFPTHPVPSNRIRGQIHNGCHVLELELSNFPLKAFCLPSRVLFSERREQNQANTLNDGWWDYGNTLQKKKIHAGTVSRSPGKYESISFTLLTRIYWTKKTFVAIREQLTHQRWIHSLSSWQMNGNPIICFGAVCPSFLTRKTWWSRKQKANKQTFSLK